MTEAVKDMLDHPFFKDFQANHVELLSECASTINLTAGGYLFRAGEKADQLHLIKTGRIGLVHQMVGRDPMPIMMICAGGVIGWSWLFPPYQWRLNASVMEDTSIIALDSKCIMEKCQEDFQLGHELMWRCARMIGERLDATRAQLFSFMKS